MGITALEQLMHAAESALEEKIDNTEFQPKELYQACQSAGRIRQIVDDFEDYYSEHHEPFGDFLQGKNRLPESIV